MLRSNGYSFFIKVRSEEEVTKSIFGRGYVTKKGMDKDSIPKQLLVMHAVHGWCFTMSGSEGWTGDR